MTISLRKAVLCFVLGFALAVLAGIATAQTTPIEVELKFDYSYAVPGTEITLNGAITRGREYVQSCKWVEAPADNAFAGVDTTADLNNLVRTVVMPAVDTRYSLYCKYAAGQQVGEYGAYIVVEAESLADIATPPSCWPKPIGEHTWPYMEQINKGTDELGACMVWFCPAYPEQDDPYWAAPGFCWHWKDSVKVPYKLADFMKMTPAEASAAWSKSEWSSLTNEERQVLYRLRTENAPTIAVPPKPEKVCAVAPNTNVIFTTRPVFGVRQDGTLDKTKILARISVGTPCNCDVSVAGHYSVSGQRSTTGAVLPAPFADGTGGAYAVCTEGSP